PPAVAVPPGLRLERAPDRDVLDRVAADDVRRHPFDDRLRREGRLRELRDRLAPADLPVVGRELDEAQMAESIEVVRLGIADGDRLDGLDAHQEIAPRKSGIPRSPTPILSRRPPMLAPEVSAVPKSQTY